MKISTSKILASVAGTVGAASFALSCPAYTDAVKADYSAINIKPVSIVKTIENINAKVPRILPESKNPLRNFLDNVQFNFTGLNRERKRRLVKKAGLFKTVAAEDAPGGPLGFASGSLANGSQLSIDLTNLPNIVNRAGIAVSNFLNSDEKYQFDNADYRPIHNLRGKTGEERFINAVSDLMDQIFLNPYETISDLITYAGGAGVVVTNPIGAIRGVFEAIGGPKFGRLFDLIFKTRYLPFILELLKTIVEAAVVGSGAIIPTGILGSLPGAFLANSLGSIPLIASLTSIGAIAGSIIGLSLTPSFALLLAPFALFIPVVTVMFSSLASAGSEIFRIFGSLSSTALIVNLLGLFLGAVGGVLGVLAHWVSITNVIAGLGLLGVVLGALGITIAIPLGVAVLVSNILLLIPGIGTAIALIIDANGGPAAVIAAVLSFLSGTGGLILLIGWGLTVAIGSFIVFFGTIAATVVAGNAVSGIISALTNGSSLLGPVSSLIGGPIVAPSFALALFPLLFMMSMGSVALPLGLLGSVLGSAGSFIFGVLASPFILSFIGGLLGSAASAGSGAFLGIPTALLSFLALWYQNSRNLFKQWEKEPTIQDRFNYLNNLLFKAYNRSNLKLLIDRFKKEKENFLKNIGVSRFKNTLNDLYAKFFGLYTNADITKVNNLLRLGFIKGVFNKDNFSLAPLGFLFGLLFNSFLNTSLGSAIAFQSANILSMLLGIIPGLLVHSIPSIGLELLLQPPWLLANSSVSFAVASTYTGILWLAGILIGTTSMFFATSWGILPSLAVMGIAQVFLILIYFSILVIGGGPLVLIPGVLGVINPFIMATLATVFGFIWLLGGTLLASIALPISLPSIAGSSLLPILLIWAPLAIITIPLFSEVVSILFGSLGQLLGGISSLPSNWLLVPSLGSTISSLLAAITAVPLAVAGAAFATFLAAAVNGILNAFAFVLAGNAVDIKFNGKTFSGDEALRNIRAGNFDINTWKSKHGSGRERINTDKNGDKHKNRNTSENQSRPHSNKEHRR